MDRAPWSAFDSLPWALLLIWWGILELVPAQPGGVGALGVAVILLGVNGLRAATGSSVRPISITVGAAALVTSALLLSQSVFHSSFYVPILPVWLIVCGAAILAWGVLKSRAARSTSSGGTSRAKSS